MLSFLTRASGRVLRRGVAVIRWQPVSAMRSVQMRTAGLAMRPFSTETKAPSEPELPDMTPEQAAEMKEAIENMFKDQNLGGNPTGDDVGMSINAEPIDPNKGSEPTVTVESNEAASGESQNHSFKAETKEILDIVAHSLYTDKEVFVRELISNASDALEKARYMSQHGTSIIEDDRAFEIHISTDVDAKTITFQDFGVGMTKTEMMDSLGKIAHSGSKRFRESLKESSGSGGDPSAIIGQFGVGFYSSLMVGDKVEVFSQSAVPAEDGSLQPAHHWVTDGDGSFEIGEATGVLRGTKIIIHLKEDARNFSVRRTIEGIVMKYSNFVGYPIYLNGSAVNSQKAIWVMDQKDVTEEEHVNFYKFTSNSFDSPPFRMHFRTDAPIDIKALFYFPERHMEKMGMGRMDPGVSVYCRKVLIKAKSKEILPDWCRFVKGVVDSEDIPLNISRENLQDSALIARLNTVLTKRIIKFLDTQSKKNTQEYLKWFEEFGQFIKEGVCSDFANKNDIAKLLRYDTSLAEEDSSTGGFASHSLDDYISRMTPGQEHIYYLVAPSRSFALDSPYYEMFNKKGTEVLFLYNGMDDFVMKNLESYGTRKLVSIESTEASNYVQEDAEEKTEEEKKAEQAAHESLLDFVQETLGNRVSSVTISNRLVNTPAIVVDHESASFRRMLKYVDQKNENMLPKQKLEINPDHKIFSQIASLRDSSPQLAELITEQVFDNALIAADILDNPRTMLSRLNKILESVGPATKEAETM
jgi:TNF receptor-associated protein 1